MEKNIHGSLLSHDGLFLFWNLVHLGFLHPYSFLIFCLYACLVLFLLFNCDVKAYLAFFSC